MNKLKINIKIKQNIKLLISKLSDKDIILKIKSFKNSKNIDIQRNLKRITNIAKINKLLLFHILYVDDIEDNEIAQTIKSYNNTLDILIVKNKDTEIVKRSLSLKKEIEALVKILPTGYKYLDKFMENADHKKLLNITSEVISLINKNKQCQ